MDNVTVIYGIKNCDTMKKTFNWLTERGAEYRFHDYRKDGLTSARLHDWCKALGWKTLINTRGTTWRKLTPEEQAIDTQSAAVQLMLTHTSLIKRPVVETASGHLLVGFDPALFASFIKTSGAESQ